MLSAGASAVMKMAAILMKAALQLCNLALGSHAEGAVKLQQVAPRMPLLWPRVWPFNHRAALNQTRTGSSSLEPFKIFVWWKTQVIITNDNNIHHHHHRLIIYIYTAALKPLFVPGVACCTSASHTKVLLRLSRCCCCVFTQARINCQGLLKERQRDDRGDKWLFWFCWVVCLHCPKCFQQFSVIIKATVHFIRWPVNGVISPVRMRQR